MLNNRDQLQISINMNVSPSKHNHNDSQIWQKNEKLSIKEEVQLCKNSSFNLGATAATQTTHISKNVQEKHSTKEKTCIKHKRKKSLDIFTSHNPIPTTNFNQNKFDTKLIFVINYISQKIENNDTHDCNYAIFHIMNCFSQAERLTIFTQHQKNSIGYLLLTKSLKKLSELSKKQPLQVEEQVFYDVIAQSLQFGKHKFEEKYYSKKLRQFMEQNKVVLNNFMPLYYTYFQIVAQFDSIFSTEPSILETLSYIKKKEAEVRQKYHRENI